MKPANDVSHHYNTQSNDLIIHSYTTDALATEVGKRKFKLHLQGVLELRYPKTMEYRKILNKTVKALLPGPGYRSLIKPLLPGQTIEAMVGYVEKGVYSFSTNFNINN